MSLFLPDLDALFVHVPRTGGTWVKRVLRAADVRIQPAVGPGDHNLPERYEGGRFRFCFVRHPVGWVESAWRGLYAGWPVDWQPRGPLYDGGTFSPFRALARCGRREFPDFVRAVLDLEPGFVSRMIEWYVGPPGAPKVNAVGRQERLRSDLAAILGRLGWHEALPAVPAANVGDGPPVAWPGWMLEKFQASEGAALRRFYSDHPGPFFVGS